MCSFRLDVGRAVVFGALLHSCDCNSGASCNETVDRRSRGLMLLANRSASRCMVLDEQTSWLSSSRNGGAGRAGSRMYFTLVVVSSSFGETSFADERAFAVDDGTSQNFRFVPEDEEEEKPCCRSSMINAALSWGDKGAGEATEDEKRTCLGMVLLSIAGVCQRVVIWSRCIILDCCYEEYYAINQCAAYDIMVHHNMYGVRGGMAWRAV